MQVTEKIAAFRARMKDENFAAVIVPTADSHASEYIADHFKTRQWLSGFTGSAGTLVVGEKEAALFVDGRYFIQAEQQIAGSGILLMKEGLPGVPSLSQFILETLPGQTLGLDGRCVSLDQAKAWAKAVTVVDVDLISPLWQNRPPLFTGEAFRLADHLAGRTAQDKLRDLRSQLKAAGAKAMLLTDLMDCAWLLNIRGQDIPHTPVVRMFVLAEAESLFLFMEDKAAAPIQAYLKELGAEIRPYDAVYAFLSRYGAGDTLLVTPSLSFALGQPLLERGVQLTESAWSARSRNFKTPGELKAIREAHIKDGVVMTRFLRWVKEQGGTGLDEAGAAARLDQMRLEAGCSDISFTTISAYGPNAALPHYSAPAQGSAKLEKKGLYLVDSGGQWPGATTDITRTVAMGPLTRAEKAHCTLVVRAMLALMDAAFPRGMDGSHVDVFARRPLWAAGLNYGHGTGHGVGAMLSVHEGPARINYGQQNTLPFQPGIVISDEPGLYFEGEHGVRMENLVECVELPTGMLGFVPLTMAPIDRDVLDPALMEPIDIRRLDAYHALVYDALSPYLHGEDLDYLENATQAL